MSDSIAPRRVKRGWMNLRVAKIHDETHDTKTFYMVDAEDGGRPYDFVAGQYLTFRYDTIQDKPVVRSYTMSGSPRQEDASIVTVKRVEGGLVSNWMCDNIQVGTILRARGPIGKFVFDPKIDREHLMMVGAGSGVTPFVSILREYANMLGQVDAPKRMSLLVAYRSREDLICWPTLQEVANIPGVQIITTLTRDPNAGSSFWHGRPDPAMMARFFDGHYGNCTVMTCGPQAMMDLVKSHCLAHDVPPEHVKTESFES